MTGPAKSFDERFLIIAGTSKAGTTSVFNYLSEHPQIWPSRAKETRFFLDLDYPLSSELRCDRDGGNAYLSFFDILDGKTDNWKLEATPDYLYSAGTARRIRETLGRVRLIFILREPISRLISFYGFGRQLNEIPSSWTFDEYVERQKSGRASDSLKGIGHPALMALQQGRYSDYLQPYLELFGREGIYLTFYEELKSDPVAFMKAMCNWAQIEGGFFDGRDFPVTNRGLSVRNPRLHRLYFDLRNRTRAALENRRSRLGMRALGRTASRIYRLLNVKDRVQTPMSTSTREFLESYYAEEAGRLTEMFGVHPPWRSNQENSAEIRASASSQDSGRLVKSA